MSPTVLRHNLANNAEAAALQAAADAAAAAAKCKDSDSTLRHSEHHDAHLLSNIEKLTLPILGSMFPFWIPTGYLVCQLETTKYIG
jgi:hypothetical protein